MPLPAAFPYKQAVLAHAVDFPKISRKGHKNYKNHQSKIKNTITEVKNILEDINSRLDETEDQDKVANYNQTEQPNEKRLHNVRIV